MRIRLAHPRGKQPVGAVVDVDEATARGIAAAGGCQLDEHGRPLEVDDDESAPAAAPAKKATAKPAKTAAAKTRRRGRA
jgi:hypothetical protein